MQRAKHPAALRWELQCRCHGIPPGQLRFVEDEALERGLAVVDAPDIDSLEHANRALADRLVEAADLCCFVTTATRYADRVPWAVLSRVAERGLPLLVVVNRMPPDPADRSDILADIRRLLADADLNDLLAAQPGTLATVGIALSAAWVVLWILVRPATASVELPLLGPVSSPFVALVGFLLAGYVLARLLGAHARWVGSRWSTRVRDRVAEAIDLEVRKRAFGRLDALEGARSRLTAAVAHIGQSCGESEGRARRSRL